MTSIPAPPSVPHTAAVQLRGGDGPVWARLYSPPSVTPSTAKPPLLVFFPSHSDTGNIDVQCRQICLRRGLVILARSMSTECRQAVTNAWEMVGWAADHAAELEADPDRLFVAGTGIGADLATDVTRLAAEEGWPVLTLLDLAAPAIT
jgi:acetyl esterase/lipase